MSQGRWELPALFVIFLAGDVAPQADRPQERPFVFRDVGQEAGLFPHVAGIQGHAAAWGDVDGDGWLDLYVGTFHQEGSKPNLFFRNSGGKFRLDDQEVLRTSGAAGGAVFADLDNDGDLDFFLSNLAKSREGPTSTPNQLFLNDGGGKFTNVSEGNGACPPGFKGRSAAVLDFDGDGLLDLLVGEDQLYGSKKRSRLFRNKGDLAFEDVSDAVGLPAGVPAAGVAAGDVNRDEWPDIFLANSDGGNRLFLNDGRGRFREAPGTRDVFAWPLGNPEDTSCGVAIADVNRDSLPDIVVGHHYKRPWVKPVSIRLYLNRGVQNDVPAFEDVTEAAGLKPLPMKAPHVEIQDFDNDGWPDIYTSIVKFAHGSPYPVIFRNLGVADGIPRFREHALAVNDFPTPEDASPAGSRSFFDKMLREKKIIYMAAGPSGDFDNDGRLDLFLANWWVQSPSLLLRNETAGGNWIQVRVSGFPGVNRMGIGSKVKVFPAGRLGDYSALLGFSVISAGYGYASGQPAVAHFGLGKEGACDIKVILPHGKGALSRKGVKANQVLTVGP